MGEGARDTIEKLKEEYDCPIWRCKDGQFVPLVNMTDRHLLNCVRMLQRKLNEIKEMTRMYLHPFWGPHGEGAQEAADRAMDEAWDREFVLKGWLTVMAQEVERRGLDVPKAPEPDYLPDPVSVEAVEIAGGHALIAKLPDPEEDDDGN